jgi:hypothetical protein
MASLIGLAIRKDHTVGEHLGPGKFGPVHAVVKKGNEETEWSCEFVHDQRVDVEIAELRHLKGTVLRAVPDMGTDGLLPCIFLNGKRCY